MGGQAVLRVRPSTASCAASASFPVLLCSSGLVASPQVVDVDDEPSLILADHVPDFALIDALVLLQVCTEETGTRLMTSLSD